MNFFSKNATYTVTERTKWNLDDGYSSYSNDVLLAVNPVRTNGVTYFNSLSFVLKKLKDEFLNCPYHNFIKGYFLVSKIYFV